MKKLLACVMVVGVLVGMIGTGTTVQGQPAPLPDPDAYGTITFTGAATVAPTNVLKISGGTQTIVAGAPAGWAVAKANTLMDAYAVRTDGYLVLLAVTVNNDGTWTASRAAPDGADTVWAITTLVKDAGTPTQASQVIGSKFGTATVDLSNTPGGGGNPLASPRHYATLVYSTAPTRQNTLLELHAAGAWTINGFVAGAKRKIDTNVVMKGIPVDGGVVRNTGAIAVNDPNKSWGPTVLGVRRDLKYNVYATLVFSAVQQDDQTLVSISADR